VLYIFRRPFTVEWLPTALDHDIRVFVFKGYWRWFWKASSTSCRYPWRRIPREGCRRLPARSSILVAQVTGAVVISITYCYAPIDLRLKPQEKLYSNTNIVSKPRQDLKDPYRRRLSASLRLLPGSCEILKNRESKIESYSYEG
jgi:hypothetical protein